MKYIIGLLLSGVLLTSFPGCKKDKTETAQYALSFSPHALEYVKLTEGKYLIYKDSATSLLDSVLVTTSKLENIFTPANSSYNISVPFDHEQFTLVLYKYNAVPITEWFRGTAGLVLSTLPFASSDTEAVRMYEIDGTPVFNFGESSQSNLSMTVEGRTFNNVVVAHNNTGVDINHPAYKVTDYYWANGVGIIKRRTIKTGGVIKTYTLLRNN